MLPGKKVGVGVGDLVVSESGHKAAVAKAFPAVSIAFFDRDVTRDKKVTIHRGKKYSAEKRQNERDDAARRRSEEDAERDRDRKRPLACQ